MNSVAMDCPFVVRAFKFIKYTSRTFAIFRSAFVTNELKVDIMEIRTVRKDEAKSFVEEEQCKLYYKTDKLLFGTSILVPGKKGGN